MPVFGLITVDSFSGEAIDPAYRDETDELKRGNRETIEQNFEGFDVCVLATDNPDPQSATAFSTIYFGGSQLDYLGQAEDVDQYNANPSDNAVVYTTSFTRP